MPVHFPFVTLGAAGVLGLVFTVLSVLVVVGRTTSKVMLGDGLADAPVNGGGLLVAIRSHANFAEFVPLCLLLIAGLEMRSGATVLVEVLAAVLVLARLSHPIGMRMASPNPFRAAGFVGTLVVLAIASAAAIVAMV